MSPGELYPVARTVHLGTVGATIALFTVRGYWMLRESGMLRRRWVRIAPHVNDTLLLASAIVLAWTTRQAPWTQPWLAAKLVALLAYIGLGMVALRAGRTKAVRGWAWLAAMGAYAYIVSVAVTRSPLPGLGTG